MRKKWLLPWLEIPFSKRSFRRVAFHCTVRRNYISHLLVDIPGFPLGCSTRNVPLLGCSPSCNLKSRASFLWQEQRVLKNAGWGNVTVMNALTIPQRCLHSSGRDRCTGDETDNSYTCSSHEDHSSHRGSPAEGGVKEHQGVPPYDNVSNPAVEGASPLSNSACSSSLASTLQRLVSSFQKSEIVRHEHGEELSALRRHLILVEQRLSALDMALEEKEGQLQEVLRATGDLHVQASGMQQVVRQLEKRWELLGFGDSTDSHKNEVKKKYELPSSVEKQSISAQEASAGGLVFEPGSRLLKDAEGQKSHVENGQKAMERMPDCWKGISERLAALEAAILGKSSSTTTTALPPSSPSACTEGAPCVVKSVPSESSGLAQGESPNEAGETAVATYMPPAPAATTVRNPIIPTSPLLLSSQQERDNIRNQLIEQGIVPYRDLKTSKVCVASKTVLVRGAPFFWGAAHIRELCETRVGGVVSCLLFRPVPPLSMPTEMNTTLREEGTLPAPATETTDARKSLERVFEVVFRDPLQAVKALNTLHNIPIAAHPRRKGTSFSHKVETTHLLLEPVVSERFWRMVHHLRATNRSTIPYSFSSTPSFSFSPPQPPSFTSSLPSARINSDGATARAHGVSATLSGTDRETNTPVAANNDGALQNVSLKTTFANPSIKSIHRIPSPARREPANDTTPLAATNLTATSNVSPCSYSKETHLVQPPHSETEDAGKKSISRSRKSPGEKRRKKREKGLQKKKKEETREKMEDPGPQSH